MRPVSFWPLCALVLGIGIGGGALLHVIGRFFA